MPLIPAKKAGAPSKPLPLPAKKPALPKPAGLNKASAPTPPEPARLAPPTVRQGAAKRLGIPGDNEHRVLPTIFQEEGVRVHVTSHSADPGYAALRAACERRGLSFAIVSTYSRDGGETTAVGVLVGHVIEGRALHRTDMGLRTWDSVDQALGAAAKRLEGM